jgi:hypothetical protein
MHVMTHENIDFYNMTHMRLGTKVPKYCNNQRNTTPT